MRADGESVVVVNAIDWFARFAFSAISIGHL